jgi:flagellar FliJ protein
VTAPFRFRLERLLDVRRLREDLASRDLALARRAVEEQEIRVRGLRDEAVSARDARRGLQQEANLDLHRVRLHRDYEAELERRLEGELRRLGDLGRAESERRGALVEARRGVKVLERLRERRLREHGRAEARRDQERIDEAARATAPERP